MKKILVIGPEHSGTRYMTEVLVKAGAYGDYTHKQRMDDRKIPTDKEIVVLRRSVPHGNEIEPDISWYIDKDTWFVVIMRSYPFLNFSQERDKGLVKTDSDRITEAYKYIMSIVEPNKTIIVSHEALIKYGEYVPRMVCEKFGLKYNGPPPYDVSSKYIKKL